MASVVVQFRQDETSVQFLQGLGLNPNEFGKDAFDRAIRVLRAQENMRQLSAMQERIRKRLKGRPFFDKPVAELIREDRDSH